MSFEPRRSFLRDIVTILVVSIFFAFVHNAFSSKGISLLRKKVEKVAVDDSTLFGGSKHQSIPAESGSTPERADPSSTNDRVSSSATEVQSRSPEPGGGGDGTLRTITLDQFKRILDLDRAIVFDARDPESYRNGRIAGSHNIFGLEAGDHFEELVMLPRDTLAVIYCNNPECHLGHLLAEFMTAIGFTNLLLYDDGYDGWTGSGMPVDTTATNQ